MKRIFKLFTFIFLIILLSGCGKEKVALSKEEFAEKLGEQGFIVSDVTTQIEDENITFVASASNNLYQIEVYVFKDDNYAKEAYKTNKESFVNLTNEKGKEKTNDNYEKYTQSLSDTYNMVVRLDNTLVYSSVNKEYKKSLDKVIKNIGY